MHRDHVVGSQLSMKGMPRKADSVILHTRAATQGTHWDNKNNHPQVSPEGNIRLVHNGHISNDFELRKTLTGGADLPEVDTSVAPAVLEEWGTEGTGLIAGWAAFAWLDDRTGNALHLARLDYSPIAMARLLDGSIVFASTEQILARALIKCGLRWIGNYPDTFIEFSDGDYVTITDGNVSMHEKLDWYDDYREHGNAYTYSGWGKAGTGDIARGGRSSEYTQGQYHYVKNKLGVYQAHLIMTDAFGVEGYWHEQAWVSLGQSGAFDADGFWRDDLEPDDTPLALERAKPTRDSFYVMDHDGDYQGFVTLEAMVNFLLWNGDASLTADESWNLLTDLKDIAWVNIARDIGHIDDKDAFVSWVQDPDQLDEYEGAIDGGLQFIIDGVRVLEKVMA